MMTDSSSSCRSSKRCVKITKKQAAIMVEYMENHKDFACGRYKPSQRKHIMTKKWNELKTLLDMHGAPKTLEQWRRENSPYLSNTEKRILDIVGIIPSTPVNKPSKGCKPSIPEREIYVPNIESIANMVPMFPVPAISLHQPPTISVHQSSAQTTVKSANTLQKEKAKPHHKNDRLDGILTKLETYRAENLELMKVIANGITTIAQGQRDILMMQKERLKFAKEAFKLERQRLEAQVKMEGSMMEILEFQKRMASAQE